MRLNCRSNINKKAPIAKSGGKGAFLFSLIHRIGRINERSVLSISRNKLFNHFVINCCVQYGLIVPPSQYPTPI